MPNTILYSFRRCPYAMRARLALFSAQIEHEHREILLKDKHPTFLKISPKGTVPVLVTKAGDLIEESMDIMRWALDKNDPELLLSTSNDTYFNSFISLVDNNFKIHLDGYKYSRDDDNNKIKYRDEACKFLNELNIKLAKNNWLMANDPKICDLAILPFIRQFANVDNNWFSNQPWPNIHRWLNSFLESNRFLSIMYKYKKWEIGHSPIHIKKFSL